MLKTLRDITQNVALADTLENALGFLVSRTKDAMNTESCSVYILEHEKLVLAATDGLAKQAVGKVKVSFSEGLIGLVAKQKEMLNLSHAPLHPQFKLCAEVGEHHFQGLLAAPIIFQKQILGVIAIQQTKASQFTDVEEAFVTTLAAQLASVIHSLSLKEQLENHVEQIQYQGICTSRGITIAPALVLGGEISFQQQQVKSQNIEFEFNRLQIAIEKSREVLKALLQRLATDPDNDVVSILTSLESLLNDNSLGGEFTQEVRLGWTAESAVSRVSKRFIEQFSNMQDPYLKERANDIRDLGIKVLRQLIEPDRVKLNPKNPVVLIVKEVDTTLLADFPRQKLAGIVTEFGGVNSHTAIVARALNVPALTGVEQIFSHDIDNKLVVLNATNGRLLVSPSISVVEEYKAQISNEHKLQKQYAAELELATKTIDNQHIELYLNAGLMAGMENEIVQGIDGIGLYRTEMTFMMEEGFPSEFEQINNYKQVLKVAKGRPVVMRTLDVGGDKPLPYFPIKEQNPFLGWRGIRFSLDHPELFLIQLRAMLQSNSKSDQLSILLPMVSSLVEIDSAIAYLQQAYDELAAQSKQKIVYPKIGIMLEVPALIFQLKEIADRVDFISVGSNDLTQYLLAVDRNNPQVGDLFDAYHPGVLRALKCIVEECQQYHLSVSICGEFAGEPMGALLLVAMGYQKLSMNLSSLARINYLIRRVDKSELNGLLKNILQQSTSENVRQILSNYLKLKGLNAMIDC